MAQSTQREAQALIARIESSRVALGNDLSALRRKLDVPARVKDSIMSKPLAWFGGSLGAGFVGSKLLRRPRHKETKKRRGLMSLALGSVFALAKPSLQTLLVRALQARFLPPTSGPDRHS